VVVQLLHFNRWPFQLLCFDNQESFGSLSDRVTLLRVIRTMGDFLSACDHGAFNLIYKIGSFSRSVWAAACSYNRCHRGFTPPELGINPFWNSGRVENERSPGDQNLVRVTDRVKRVCLLQDIFFWDADTYRPTVLRYSSATSHSTASQTLDLCNVTGTDRPSWSLTFPIALRISFWRASVTKAARRSPRATRLTYEGSTSSRLATRL
jgi:hypothetical protein